MSKFIAIIFPDETTAYEGTRVLKELNRDGSLVLYGETVLTKDPKGKVTAKEIASDLPLGAAVGVLTGALVGLLTGPIGAIAGLTSGVIIGGLKDIYDVGVSTSFVEEISEKLAPGKAMVIAEVEEEWTIPLDAQIKALGGEVVRVFRNDVEDEQIAREIAEAKADLARLREEYKNASGKAKEHLQARIDEATQHLEKAVERAKSKANALRKEAETKVDALQEQVKTKTEQTKKKWEKLEVDIRDDYKRRASKLDQAWELTKDALK